MIRFLIEVIVAALLLCFVAPKIENRIKSELWPKTKKELRKVSDEKRNKIIETAKEKLGVPYSFGGTSFKTGVDCSYFVQYVYGKNNIKLPRTASQQYAKCINTWDEPDVGDLVFFQTYTLGPSHVGIYMGGNRFCHASSSDNKVVISKLDQPYYRKHYIGARRISC